MTSKKISKNVPFVFLFFLICAIYAPSNFAQIYISEVLYDPLSTESGGEAVELYNSGSEAINLWNYTIKTASSEKDAVFPENAIIAANGYYLITDANWNEKKDFATYPFPDYEEPITMTNTVAGVSLLDNKGNLIDSVCWGELANEEESIQEFCEGLPTNNSENGYSLQRVSYTNNNYEDFISYKPNLINSKNETTAPNAGIISLEVIVEEKLDPIRNISFINESYLVLNPGKNLDIPLEFTTDETDIDIFLNEQEIPVTLESFEDEYHANTIVRFPYTLLAGNYTLHIISPDFEYNYSFEILPMLGFQLDLQNITCHSETCIVEGDSNISTINNPTLQNIGNTNLDLKIFAESNSELKLTPSTISLRLDDESITLSEEPIIHALSLSPASLLPITLEVDTSLLDPGLYNSNIVFMGVGSD